MSGPASEPPSADNPLEGGCLCGAVRYSVTASFRDAGYCHCTHCQRRTGTGFSINGRVPRDGFRLTQGADLMRSFAPPGGRPKVFCEQCGSALFSGNPLSDEVISVRFGTLDADPAFAPEYHQYVDSKADWDTIPDDGLIRYPASRPPWQDPAA